MTENDIAKLLEQDLMGTEKMMDFFEQGEQMLTEQLPFNQHKWASMMNEMRQADLFKQNTSHLNGDISDKLWKERRRQLLGTGSGLMDKFKSLKD